MRLNKDRLSDVANINSASRVAGAGRRVQAPDSVEQAIRQARSLSAAAFWDLISHREWQCPLDMLPQWMRTFAIALSPSANRAAGNPLDHAIATY